MQVSSTYPKLACLCIVLSALMVFRTEAQNLPAEFHLSPDGKILSRGDQLASGLYDRNIIRDVHINFPQANYWTQLTNNYATETYLLASIIIDDVTYDSVGVRFRGNTSYQMTGQSQKKSFAVATDFVREDQRIMGYKNLKFNNGHQDASFMREVLYNRMAKKYTPIAKANYIHLFLNDVDWGIYPNIQDVDKTFLKEWFLSNDGAKFRATVEGQGPGGGGGPGWGDGTGGMNYLGTDTAQYKKYYTLKSSDVDSSWQKLIHACQVLSTATSNNKDDVKEALDIDKILWFLAAENIFADDDSYIMKGKMDYYVYYEPETALTFPLEYDGNSAFLTDATTSWSPFKNVTNVNYPLLNKLLNIPEWRQRYLAHYRTILNETFTTANANAIIDSLDSQIKALVAADTKKLYSTNQYTNAIPALKTFVSNRRNYLVGNAEVAQVTPQISYASYVNSNEESVAPKAGEEAYVSAQVTSVNGIDHVSLYYAAGIAGNFQKTEMLDDGLHHDGIAGDGIYGGTIPGFNAGTLVRFYIEAIAGNAALSASYQPQGAEHDVFVYYVEEVVVSNGVVINELLASNTNGATDEAGDHEDWIELYNNNDFEVNLGGFHLSDNPDNPLKWEIPAGTIIPEYGYLIIWADEDGSEAPLHADFKLSAAGETLTFSDPDGALIDQVIFGAQASDVAYARIPNGSGDFVQQAPTFNANNEIPSAVHDVAEQQIKFYPNPMEDVLNLEVDPSLIHADYFISDLTGRLLSNGILSSTINTIDMSRYVSGNYFLTIGGNMQITMKIVKL
ncbi:MAG TPA: CotH kinase family protein [Saprospiraceae bacterium]|nr:CotH kinase family protein [Saprospiraceae bacterium]